MAMTKGLLFPDVVVYAFNPTAVDDKYISYLRKKDKYKNINVLIYDQELAYLERLIQYGKYGLKVTDLPVNVYHIDIDKAGDRNNKQFPSLHSELLDEHSTGALRSLDKSLWDPFNIKQINFSAGGTGTKEIKFTKKRYTDFANILQNELLPYLKIAILKLEETADEVDQNIKNIIARAEEQIQRIQISLEALPIGGSDPRQHSIESLKREYYKNKMYRCYDEAALNDVFMNLQKAIMAFVNIAPKIHEMANYFETVDKEILRVDHLSKIQLGGR